MPNDVQGMADQPSTKIPVCNPTPDVFLLFLWWWGMAGSGSAAAVESIGRFFGGGDATWIAWSVAVILMCVTGCILALRQPPFAMLIFFAAFNRLFENKGMELMKHLDPKEKVYPIILFAGYAVFLCWFLFVAIRLLVRSRRARMGK